jgi:hypothetical protein
MSKFESDFDRIKLKLILWFKRIYVIAFNAYVWFWLYRQIFIKHSNSFENYLLWGFSVVSMFFFVKRNDDIFFKTKN